jgi:L-malate glycosyltransferase
VIRPQPTGRVGGADLHIADLAEAQQLGRFRPIVVALANRDYVAHLRNLGVSVLAPEPPWSLQTLARLHREILEEGVLLVHSHGYEGDYLGVALARGRTGRRRLPLITTSHGLVRTSIQLRAKTWLDLRCFNAADQLISTSRLEARRLANTTTVPVEYVPNGVKIVPCRASAGLGGEIRARFGMPSSARLVTFVGRLAPEKRPDLFIRAARSIAQVNQDAWFLILGTGSEEPKLRRLTATLGLGNRLRFAGTRRDVPAILSTADLLMCLSDSEGTPRAVIEAMAYGAVVVATNVGGIPDLIDHRENGLLVEPRNVAAAARSAVAVLESHAMRDALRARARAKAHSDFGIERMEQRVAAIYDAAVDAFTSNGSRVREVRGRDRVHGRLSGIRTRA